MTKKKDDKKIGEVKSATETRKVESTEAISEVTKVKPTSGVTGVSRAYRVGKNRPTRIMTAAEREYLFSVIDEEANKLFGSGVLPKEKKEVVQKAVKMAVDAGLLDEEKEKSS